MDTELEDELKVSLFVNEKLRARIAALEAENAKLKAKLWSAIGEICDKAARAAMEGKE